MYPRAASSKKMQAILREMLSSVYIQQRLNAYEHWVTQLQLGNIVELR